MKVVTIVVALVIVIWLGIGVVIAQHRGYFGDDEMTRCHTTGDTAITILAGPLNRMGVNPKVKCAA